VFKEKLKPTDYVLLNILLGDFPVSSTPVIRLLLN